MTLTHGETVLAQATGMVSVQAHCTLDEALARILDCARGMCRSEEKIAEAIVARELRFSPA
jgi:hypothetical protein